MVTLSEVQARLLRLTNERETILNEIANKAKKILDGQPPLNERIDNRKTILKSVELSPPDPSCREIITLELIQTDWGDNEPKGKVIIVTSKVFTPSTGQMEEVYDFGLSPVGAVQGSHNNIQKFTNETFKAVLGSIKNYRVQK